MSVDISFISSVDFPADARLHRILSALLRDGLTCEVRTRGDAQQAPHGALFHSSLDGKGFAKRILRDLVLPFRAEGRVWIVDSPDLLITASIIGRLRGRKVVADIREDYQRLLKDRAWAKSFFGIAGVLGAASASLANNSAKRADLTTVADVQVPPHSAKNRLLLRNYPDQHITSIKPTPSTDPVAIYIGDVRTSRGLRMMLAAAEQSPQWRFEIIGNVAATDEPFVDQWRKAHPEAATRVNFRGRLDPISSWKYAESAWVGLTLLESTPAFVDAVPSKLYEYMAAGLAIISTPLPRCVELIEQSGAGSIAASADDVAAALHRFESDRAYLDKCRKDGSAWAEKHLDGAAEYGKFVTAVRALL